MVELLAASLRIELAELTGPDPLPVQWRDEVLLDRDDPHLVAQCTRKREFGDFLSRLVCVDQLGVDAPHDDA